MNRLTTIIICLVVGISAPCQSKKEIKKFKIRSATEWETLTADGKTNTYKTSYEEFDKAGHSILKIEYGPDGSILHKETATYNNYGKKTEESEWDVIKKKNTRKVYKYNAMQDRTEEVEYNAAGVILKMIAFTYDADGNKTVETITDPAGNILKKMTFTYNAKNLKTGKQTFTKSAVPESVKKWDYVYY